MPGLGQRHIEEVHARETHEQGACTRTAGGIDSTAGALLDIGRGWDVGGVKEAKEEGQRQI